MPLGIRHCFAMSDFSEHPKQECPCKPHPLGCGGIVVSDIKSIDYKK